MVLKQLPSLGDLQKRFLVTIGLLLLTRLGTFIPVPGIDHEAFYQSTANNNTLRFLNIFSGGAVLHVGLFALGIGPYINASIIMQLLTPVIPALEKLQKEEGELGRRKIAQYSRYVTLAAAIVQGYIAANWVRPYVFNWNFQFSLEIMLTLSAGAMVLMWISELITEKGIGNGASLLICVNIVTSFPKIIGETLQIIRANDSDLIKVVFFILSFFFIVFGIVLVQEATRRIPIVSARQLEFPDENVNGEGKNYLPLRINPSGVMPVIFASSILVLPLQLIQAIDNSKVQELILLISPTQSNKLLYLIPYFLLILFFSYFYTSLILNPEDVSQNLNKMASSIPGIRPGYETKEYLEGVIKNLTVLGSIFLTLISVLPNIVQAVTGISTFGGLANTSLLILVGVGMDITRQVRAYQISANYKDMIS